jgi:hypothetical protein
MVYGTLSLIEALRNAGKAHLTKVFLSEVSLGFLGLESASLP